MSNAATAVGAKGAGRVRDYAPTYGALAALVLLLAINSVFTPNFFDVNNFRNILLQVAPTVLVAVGMTLVIATGGIDLSVGSVMAIASAVAAARLAGGKVHRTKVTVYALSGLLAGLAGLIETARLGASDAQKVGLNIELDAIAATVVGGTPLTGGRATVLGTLVGALIMQVITTGFVMNGISYSWSLVIKAAIIIVAVYIQRPKVA